MKLYDLVKKILQEDTQARNSDKYLQWEILKRQNNTMQIEWFGGYKEVITKDKFLSQKTISMETIRRTRQKIQEIHSELGPTSGQVIKARKKKQATGGNFIFREQIAESLF